MARCTSAQSENTEAEKGQLLRQLGRGLEAAVGQACFLAQPEHGAGGRADLMFFGWERSAESGCCDETPGEGAVKTEVGCLAGLFFEGVGGRGS